MGCRALCLLAVAAYCGATWVTAQEPRADEQAIRNAARQYVEALRQGDVKALEALWAPGGELVDEYGRVTPARQLIEQESQLKGRGADDAGRPHVEVTDNSIRFVTPDVALEDGVVAVADEHGGRPAERGKYLAVWVKLEGRWRLASLRESRVTSSAADDLASLDWMTGDWTGSSGAARFDVSTHWNSRHTFLERDLTVTHDGQVLFSGHQRIGIDPLDGKIKSWVHDADGGHGEGVWTRHGDAWVVQAQSVSPDGQPASATNVYTHSGDSVRWKSIGGFSHGQAVPDFEIEMKRAGTAAR